MAFYSVQNDTFLAAPNRVRGPRGLALDAKKKDDYTYPVEGWYWFDTEKAARKALNAWDDYSTPAQTASSADRINGKGVVLDDEFVIRFAKTFGWDGSGTAQDFFYTAIKTLMKEKLSAAM